MKYIDFFILGLNGFVWGSIIILLIYFTHHQLKQRKKEKFEKRDN